MSGKKMNLKTQFVQFLSAVACVAMAASTSAATVSFAMIQPTPGPDDIANLQGATEEAKNVNEGDHDAIYIADDRPTQGQTFKTGTNATGYVLRAITMREVAFDTYALVPDLTYTIRITEPADGKLSVLSTETAKVAADTSGNFPTIGDGNDKGSGSGRFITFALEKPVVLKPNTIYGFDVSGGTERHYWQWDGTDTDAYRDGVAYSLPKGKMAERTGDHVFAVALTRATVTESAKAAAQADDSASNTRLANRGAATESK
jgi:hypothetical protein